MSPVTSPSRFIGAGDPSGDLLAALVMDEARPLLGTTPWWGYGGERLERAGVRLVGRLERFGTSGLSEILTRLPGNAALAATVLGMVESRPPVAAVLVDYPDLHALLGPALRRAGSRVVWLLPPQVWAWRRGRLDSLRARADAVAVAFPFEVEIYRARGVPVELVGHPLCRLPAYAAAERHRPPPPVDHPVIAFLPGSRPHEVRATLPIMLEAGRRIASAVPSARFRLAPAPSVPERIVEETLSGFADLPVERVQPPRPDVLETTTSRALRGASAAVVHAGTATLECALAGVPSVVVARIGRLSWHVARRLVSVEHVAMPSILLHRPVFPELLQDAYTPDAVASRVLKLAGDEIARRRVRDAGDEISSMLDVPDGPARFAGLVGFAP